MSSRKDRRMILMSWDLFERWGGANKADGLGEGRGSVSARVKVKVRGVRSFVLE